MSSCCSLVSYGYFSFFNMSPWLIFKRSILHVFNFFFWSELPRLSSKLICLLSYSNFCLVNFNTSTPGVSFFYLLPFIYLKSPEHLVVVRMIVYIYYSWCPPFLSLFPVVFINFFTPGFKSFKPLSILRCVVFWSCVKFILFLFI